jgi:hypothetical protein
MGTGFGRPVVAYFNILSRIYAWGTEVNRVYLSRDGLFRDRFSNSSSFEYDVGVFMSRFYVAFYASLRAAESESAGG